MSQHPCESVHINLIIVNQIWQFWGKKTHTCGSKYLVRANNSMKITGIGWSSRCVLCLSCLFHWLLVIYVCILGVEICKISLAPLSLNIDKWRTIKRKHKCPNECSDHFVSRLVFSACCGSILWFHSSDSFSNQYRGSHPLLACSSLTVMDLNITLWLLTCRYLGDQFFTRLWFQS